MEWSDAIRYDTKNAQLNDKWKMSMWFDWYECIKYNVLLSWSGLSTYVLVHGTMIRNSSQCQKNHFYVNISDHLDILQRWSLQFLLKDLTY